MIRILCPHCHASLSTHELEQTDINGQRCLLCPDCAAVLGSETIEAKCSAPQVHCPDIADAHT